MTITLKASGTADFLAALPRVTGIHAPESAFMIAFDGKRTMGSARIDLPEMNAGWEDDVKDLHVMQWLGTFAELGERFGRVAVVFYTDDVLTDTPDDNRYVQLAAMLALRLRRIGVKIVDTCVVGADGWVGLLAEKLELRSLSEITESNLHEAGQQLPSIEEWRESHPGHTTNTREQMLAMVEEQLQPVS